MKEIDHYLKGREQAASLRKKLEDVLSPEQKHLAVEVTNLAEVFVNYIKRLGAEK